MVARGRVVIIGSSDAVLGLGLLGIEGVEAHGANEARAALEDALSDPHTVLVLVDETVGAALGATLETLAGESRAALVVEIPSAGADLEAGALRRRVERALGFETEA